jgi:hypothetical protein
LVIIALGFILLIAFVGIATDAALLFVRYSTLRRSVDAAAIAAAGQIREGATYAKLTAAAQQYIKFHGLDAASVFVETCETEMFEVKQQMDRWQKMTGWPPAGYDDVTVRQWLAQTVNGVPRSQLCKVEPSKLVRVSAQVLSPTTFMSVLGYNSITLVASSISQTAVMDVVLILDGSYSMSSDTIGDGEYREWPKVNGGNVVYQSLSYDQKLVIQDSNTNMIGFVEGYPDPNINPNETGGNGFTLGLKPYLHTYPDATTKLDYDYRAKFGGTPQRVYRNTSGLTPSGQPMVRGECRTPDPSEGRSRNGEAPEDNPSIAILSNYGYGGCCNDPTTQAQAYASFDEPIDYYVDSKTGLIQTTGGSVATITSGAKDGNYSDLICRPFKDVRDAARRFLLKVDFSRGDRVFMIQFDAVVNVIGQTGIVGKSVSPGSPVFYNKIEAVRSLNRFVGIEVAPAANAEQSPWVAHGWQTTCAVRPTYPRRNAWPYSSNEYFYENTATCPDTNTGGAIRDAASYLTDPKYIRRDAVWIAVLLSDGYPNRTPGISTLGGVGTTDINPLPGQTWNKNFHKIPNSATTSFQTGQFQDGTTVTDPSGLGWGFPTNRSTERFFDGQIDDSLTDPGFCPWSTFCDASGGNYPNNQPYDQSATHIGQADTFLPYYSPPRPVGSRSLDWNTAYCVEADENPQPIWWDFVNSSGDPTWHEGRGSFSRIRPICSDNNPDSRHFCVDPSNGEIVPWDATRCSIKYDADDFARDMVDFAALTDWTPTLKGNFIGMFSIFFPHTRAGSVTYLNENILGVKFLRYMADAGDNGIIDNPLQRWYRDQGYKLGAKDPVPPGSSADNDYVGYGSAGLPAEYLSGSDPCAPFDFREVGALPGSPASPNLTYEELARKQCGNYYYAGNSQAIDRAFIDIAGRLFTRLSR